MVDRSTGELLGSIGVRFLGDGVAEVGYWIAKEARGRGVATRALVLIVRWVFENDDIARFQLRAEPENVASQRVAEKAGFVREGVMRAALALKGERRDVVVYSVVRGDL